MIGTGEYAQEIVVINGYQIGYVHRQIMFMPSAWKASEIISCSPNVRLLSKSKGGQS